ncbi:replication-relaxation family protein [Alkalihalobacillus sp. BA299]|uniref:replication-relaxation family protein n=1 Tax=Alkalihalobacillus sp. BA299 TaxID=2815938 RepID=UPI001ADD4C32|nr:replication-relaxation family protein [Alkalihalobacillus sp. BA299]
MDRKSYSFDNKDNYVELEEAEVKALLLLAKQKYLTRELMYLYISSITSLKDCSYKSKIFKKYIKFDLLDPDRKEGKFGKKNYYRIGNNGIEVLKREGLLDENFKANNNQISYIDHHFGIQEATIRALDGSFRENLDTKLLGYRELMDENIILDGGIIPDSTLKLGNHYVHIEIDKGTENLNTILHKVERYIEICRNNAELHHSVVISLIDDSIETIEGQHKVKEGRIRNIKERLYSTNDLHLPNLSVYVMTLSRTHDLIMELLKGQRPYTNSIVMNNIETVAEILSYANDYFGYIFESVDSADVLTKDTPSFLFPDKCYRVNNSAGTDEHYIMFVFLEEGNVQILDRLNYLNSIIGKTKVPVRKIIGLYRNNGELSNDLVGGPFKYVLFGDGQTLSETTEERPTFLRTTSPLRMGETTYEGI